MSKKWSEIISVAAAFAAVAVTAGAARAGQQGDAVTISWSGATFMRSFTTSRGISLLNPGTSITLNAGPGGVPVTFSALTGATTSVQFAANDLTVATTPYTVGGPNNAANANYYAVRFEWHEQGSIEGVNEMVNDQIGLVSTVGNTNRNGNGGNPTWINSNPFGQNNINVIPATPAFGGSGIPGVTGATVKGHELRTSDYNASFGGNYDDSNAARPGRNTQLGQNRVQQAVSDVAARQGFAIAGTPSYLRTPGTPGYGLGNPKLSIGPGGIQGVGDAGSRKQFNVDDIVNMKTTNVDPTTGASYAAGPWNSAGVNNLDNKIVANGGLAYVANPGTGLERLNRTDNQWLHASGRLANGADFNVASRDAYSGTVNTATNNIGMDTTFAVGENDDGNTNLANGVAQTRIGSDFKLSGKTSGSSGVRPTVQNSRMGFSHLSSSDAIPSAKVGASRPVRVLDYRDDGDDVANGSNNALPADQRNNRAFADPINGSDSNLDIVNGFTRLSAKSIIEGSYASRTNQTYITVKAPNAAFAGDTAAQWAARTDVQTGIKGDNSGNDVRDFRDNILNSVANFPASSVANPGDQLLQLAFMLPQFVKVAKDFDGLNRDDPNPQYNATLSGLFLSSPTLTAPFNPDAPELIKTGSGSKYGNSNVGNGSATPVGGDIIINNGNWLFGDFDQRATNQAGGVSGKGFRDFSDLAVAQQAQASLEASGLGNDWNAGSSSNTAVAGVSAALNTGTTHFGNAGNSNQATKGDLIALGDYNSDGKFDGKDLYRMVRGTSLATGTGTTTLGSNGEVFADALRRGVLRKNAALDQLNASATASQKLQASANITNDPTGVLAFDKTDVNRDGLRDFKDAKLVDFYAGTDYRNLQNEIDAVQGLDGDSPLYTTSLTLKPISLVDVELNDTGSITSRDFGVIRPLLPNLKDGDTDFNNVIDGADYSRIDTGFNSQTDVGWVDAWSRGDFDSNEAVDGADYALIDVAFNSQSRSLIRAMDFLAGIDRSLDGMQGAALERVLQHFNQFGEGYATAFVAVPEPTSLAVVALAGVSMLSRRRRVR